MLEKILGKKPEPELMPEELAARQAEIDRQEFEIRKRQLDADRRQLQEIERGKQLEQIRALTGEVEQDRAALALKESTLADLQRSYELGGPGFYVIFNGNQYVGSRIPGEPIMFKDPMDVQVWRYATPGYADRDRQSPMMRGMNPDRLQVLRVKPDGTIDGDFQTEFYEVDAWSREGKQIKVMKYPFRDSFGEIK